MNTPLVLVLNCGSSSMKGAVMNPKSGETLLSCLAEKLNLADAYITFKFNDEKKTEDLSAKPNHTGAIESLMSALQEHQLDTRIGAVGHRVVHGGEHCKESSIITDEVIKSIEQCITLAPLHNPANLLGIQAAQKAFNQVKHIAVYDTAFHQTIPEHAYIYALPYEYYEEHDVRRYGFHGTSYRYVARETARLLNKSEDDLALVIAHLGNGASICAVLNGESRDTSMGLTPLEGLVMGTRCGDVDPSIFSFLQEQAGLSEAEVTNILNKKSGLLGISGVSNDCRAIEEASEAGNKRATLALEVFAYRLAKYVAAMTVANGRLDALVFTGGIGENSKGMRERVVKHLGFLGLEIDDALNTEMRFGNAGVITKAGKSLAIVVPTNEELMIAQDAAVLAKLS